MFCGDVLVKSVPRVRAASAPAKCVPPSALVPERVSTHARAMAPTWKEVIEWATRAVLRLFDRETFLALAGETPSAQSLETAVSSIPFVPGNPYPWTGAVLGEICKHLDEPGVDVPETASKARVLWIGDSGTKIYRTTPGGKTKSRAPVAEIEEAFPNVKLSIHGLSGFTPKDLTTRVESEDPEAWDLVVLSTYLNGVLKGTKWAGQPAELEGDFRRMGTVLKKFKRVVVICGGAADVWHYDPNWDLMVENMREILRQEGIPSITGEAFWREVLMYRDEVHAASGPEATAAWQRQFGTVLHGAYALRPQLLQLQFGEDPSASSSQAPPRGVMAETATPAPTDIPVVALSAEAEEAAMRHEEDVPESEQPKEEPAMPVIASSSSSAMGALIEVPVSTIAAVPRSSTMPLNAWQEKSVSKHLTYVLRHRPEVAGLCLDSIGRAEFDMVFSYVKEYFENLSLTPEILVEIMVRDKKNRYRMWFDERGVEGETPTFLPKLVAATQGHSERVGVVLTEAASKLSGTDLPPVIVHGTSVWALMRIVNEGIVPGGTRNVKRDTHFATKLLSDPSLKAGIRHNPEVSLFIDRGRLARAIDEEQFEVFQTAAETLLTRMTVPFAWVKRVTRTIDGMNIFQAPDRYPDAVHIPRREWWRCSRCGTWLPQGFVLCADLFNCGYAVDWRALERELSLVPRWKRESLIGSKYGDINVSTMKGLGKRSFKPPPTKQRGGNTDLKERVKRAKKMGFRGHADRYDKDVEYKYLCDLTNVDRNLKYSTGIWVEPQEQQGS